MCLWYQREHEWNLAVKNIKSKQKHFWRKATGKEGERTLEEVLKTNRIQLIWKRIKGCMDSNNKMIWMVF